MKSVYKRPEKVKYLDWDNLVALGIKKAPKDAASHNGMAWSFDIEGTPITHENDKCYLIGPVPFTPNDILLLEDPLRVVSKKNFEIEFNFKMTNDAERIEQLACKLYDNYCEAVGGKAWNGDVLPTSKEFFNDAKKTKQADAWRVIAYNSYIDIATLEQTVGDLWKIIDDIDTASDIAKENDKAYRAIVEEHQKRRWETEIRTNGYNLDLDRIALRRSLD